MLKFWRDLSVAKKLYFVVGTMATLVVLELLTLLFAMNTLSTLRAFVGGEGTWSKEQKNAVHSLHLYIYTHDQKYYADFQKHLAVPLGDRKARIELTQANPNYPVVFEGFREGQIAEGDIQNIIRMLERFHNVEYIRKAVEAWTAADGILDSVINDAQHIHDLISKGQYDSAEMKALLEKTHANNAQLSALEDDFSRILGEGSRWLEHLLMITLVLAVLTVEATGIGITIVFNRNLSRSLNEVNQAAQELVGGTHGRVVPIRSNDELGKLATTLNKMMVDLQTNIGQRERAENASQVKSLFLANMSHEIRTPLGVIIGLTEIIKDPDLDWNDRLRYIEIIENTGKNLTRIINDILDITKVEAGHMQIHKTNVHIFGLLEEMFSMMSLKAQDQDNKLEIICETPFPTEIVTDRARLHQVLLNLVNNALKFTHHGTVQVRYGLKENQVYFDIVDTGIGISVDGKKELFKNFSQVDSSTTRKYEGTGLGLVLSKRIANSLGGDVVLVESTLGKGSTFRVTISTGAISSAVKQQSASTLRSENLPLKHLEGKKVLIVDDSSDNQLLIQLYLKRRSMHTEFADNGEMALKKALDSHFDLILMDMQMPVKDGYTATRELREKGFKKPIIALTANAMIEDRDRCLNSGCNDYLTKPIESEVLFQTIAKYLLNS